MSGSPGVFDDLFIEYLFDLVEQTRGNEDETFNYAVIKLIVRRSCSLYNISSLFTTSSRLHLTSSLWWLH